MISNRKFKYFTYLKVHLSRHFFNHICLFFFIFRINMSPTMTTPGTTNVTCPLNKGLRAYVKCITENKDFKAICDIRFLLQKYPDTCKYTYTLFRTNGSELINVIAIKILKFYLVKFVSVYLVFSSTFS